MNWRDPEALGPSPLGGGLQLAMPSWTRAVRAIVLANGIVFAALFVTFLALPAGTDRETIAAIDGLLGLQAARWVAWFPFLPVWQLGTWAFVHSVYGIWHILGNMLFLFFLGTMLEELIGTRRFLAAYFSAILVSGLATLATGFFLHPEIPTVGASGAVLCVVVAMAALRPHVRVIFILFPITLRTLAILYVALDLFGLLLSLKGAGTNVAHFAHLSGAAWGFLLARQGWIWRDPVQVVGEWRAGREAERARDDEARLDELLAKINRGGIGSLSAGERAFLKRVSKRR
ncbi:MAG: rhomboid family intramembrane serine protease [Planctomycetota bacterium]